MEDNVLLEAHTVVLKEGEQASSLFLIKSGEVICLKAAKDRIIPVFLGKAGDIIGESAMIKDGVHSYSAISLGQVELVSIAASHFLNVLEDAPDWLRDLTQTMMNRLQVTSGLIAENRIISPMILSDEKFSDSLEIVFRKLLAEVGDHP